MTKNPDPKILQIIPAERGWHVSIETEALNMMMYREVVCWALCDDGSVWPMHAGDFGPELALKTEALLSPVDSWNYCVQPDKPGDEDWEACGFATPHPESAELQPLVLWRQGPKPYLLKPVEAQAPPST